MRQIRQEVAHQALVNHELAAQKLRSKNGLADLLTIQTDLMRSYLEALGPILATGHDNGSANTN